MKRLLTLFLTLISTILLVGCSITGILNGRVEKQYSGKYAVIEVTESTLLVADVDADGNVIEWSKYTAPNLFYQTYEIAVGDVITINHNGQILESYPMQFSKIYSMVYHDSATDSEIAVNAD